MPVSTIERPISALRQRMLEDMAMRGLRSDTQHDYVRVVRSFAALLRQPPSSPAPPDVSPSGIVGFLRHERVLLRDELEGQTAAVKDRAAPYGTVLKTFEQQNRLALAKTDVHIDTSLGEGSRWKKNHPSPVERGRAARRGLLLNWPLEWPPKPEVSRSPRAAVRRLIWTKKGQVIHSSAEP